MGSLLRNLVLLSLAALLLPACPPKGGGDGGPFGILHVQASGLTSADVQGVAYTLVCDDGSESDVYLPLSDQPLPDSADSDASGQPFADWFQLLPVTTCVVTATAMVDPATAAAGCTVASAEVTTIANETVEVLLPIVCEGEEMGGLDVITVITDGLSLVGASYDPEKFVVQCEPVTFSLEVSGGDGDYAYEWTVVGSPAGATWTATSDDGDFTFFSELPGQYTVTVVVTDGGGATTEFTFPIHVGQSNTVEHCDEVCCEFDDGSIGVTAAAGCEVSGGVPVALDVCEALVCCAEKGGSFGYRAAMDCPPALQVPLPQCEAVCCASDDGVAWTDPLSCGASGGTAVNAVQCLEEVCCKTGEGNTLVPAAGCAPGQGLPLEACDSPLDGVCCLFPEALPVMAISANHCVALGGTVGGKDDCTPTVCCKLPIGDYEARPIAACEDLGGTPAASADLCERVCCQAPGGSEKKLSAGACYDLGHVPLPESECPPDPITAFWDAKHTLDPETGCADSGYLVVPSSQNDQAAVFDLDTLLPIPGTPFAVCNNPSRVMMDANTDVYATCRGYSYATVNVTQTGGLSGGEVVKTDREGNLLWSTLIPMCAGTRGVAMSAGRLFAACSHGAYGIYELNPVTGAIIDSVGTPYPPYGIWATAGGIWYPMYTNQRVGHLTHTPNLALDFIIDQPDLAPYRPYGVGADAQGNGWFSLIDFSSNPKVGNRLLEVHTDGTFIIHTVPVLPNTRGATGLQVGLDGVVYLAQHNVGPGAAGFVTFDPLTSQTTQTGVSGLPLAVPHSTHGLTLDAANNVYLLERFRDRLYRFTPSGAETEFGANAAGNIFLQDPYGYSGDMTGLASSCISGMTDEWVGTTYDTGSATSTWTVINWTATTPPGSNVTVQISPDGSQLWTPVTNGQYLNIQAQFLNVKAILHATVPGNLPTLHHVQVIYQP